MKRVGARGYSDDLRERIVQARENGEKNKDVAARFGVTEKTASRYYHLAQQGKLTERKRPTGRPRLIQPEHEQQLLKQQEETPDATLQEHVDKLFETTGFKASVKTVDRALTRLGFTYKKNAGRQRKERREEGKVSRTDYPSTQ